VGRLDVELVARGGDQLGLERLGLGVVGLDQLLDRVQRVGTGIEDLGLRQEREQLSPVLGAKRVVPAVVLLELSVESLPASGGELGFLALRVRDNVGLEPVREEVLLELGLFLHVARAVALLHAVERRLGDGIWR
jgi:hypothetical protein